MVAPKKEKLAIAQKSLQETMEVLNAKRAELKEVFKLILSFKVLFNIVYNVRWRIVLLL